MARKYDSEETKQKNSVIQCPLVYRKGISRDNDDGNSS